MAGTVKPRRFLSVWGWRVLAAMLAGLSFACAGLMPGRGSSRVFYTLLPVSGSEQNSSAGHCAAGRGRKGELKLVLAPTEAPLYLNSQNIAYSRNSFTRGAYQFAAWVEPLPQKFRFMLLKELECSTSFKEVSRAELNAAGDLLLFTRLEQFYHDAAAEPGSAVVQLRAELMDIRRRSLLQAKTFESRQVVNSYDAIGAVEGLSHGAAQVIAELIGWLEASASRVEAN